METGAEWVEEGRRRRQLCAAAAAQRIRAVADVRAVCGRPAAARCGRARRLFGPRIQGRARLLQIPVRRGAGAAARDHRNRQYLERVRARSEEHTSELQSLMRISYAVFFLKKKKYTNTLY